MEPVGVCAIAMDEEYARAVGVVIAPAIVVNAGAIDLQPMLCARGVERLLEPLGLVADDVFIRDDRCLGAAIFPFFLESAGLFRRACLIGGAFCFVVSHDTDPLTSIHLRRKVTPAPFSSWHGFSLNP